MKNPAVFVASVAILLFTTSACVIPSRSSHISSDPKDQKHDADSIETMRGAEAGDYPVNRNQLCWIPGAEFAAAQCPGEGN